MPTETHHDRHQDATVQATRDPSRWNAIVSAWWRGFVGFFGCFALANVVVGMIESRSANEIWLDTRAWLPAEFGDAFVAGCGALLFGWAAMPSKMRAWRSRITRGALVILAGICMANVVQVWWLAASGAISLWMPVPLSLGLAVGFAWLAWRMPRLELARAPVSLTAVVAVAVLPVSFALSHFATFGTTDYRRPADVIVVLGARVYPDGRPSDVLADRTRTAIELFHAGYAPMLLFSGGPGDAGSGTHEVNAMRQMALAHGVPAEAIAVDPHGVNTRATIANAAAWLRERGDAARVLAVSNGYHLPRIRLEFERAGVPVATVPAEQRYVYSATPAFVLREVAAFWSYYFELGLESHGGQAP